MTVESNLSKATKYLSKMSKLNEVMLISIKYNGLVSHLNTNVCEIIYKWYIVPSTNYKPSERERTESRSYDSLQKAVWHKHILCFPHTQSQSRFNEILLGETANVACLIKFQPKKKERFRYNNKYYNEKVLYSSATNNNKCQ